VAELLDISFTWQRRPAGRPTARLRELACRALTALGISAGEVGVLVCDDARMQELNRSYRGKDKPTDVLSFPGGDCEPDGVPHIGDVAISLETAARQAESAGHTLQRELETLLLHALIHLAGHDHETDRGEMARLERRFREDLLG
jgi:probable rRNA maturation factor